MQMTSCPCLRKLSQRCDPIKPAPPVIKYLAIISSYGIILKPKLSDIRRIVEVTAIKDNRVLEQLLDSHKVRSTEFIPFSQNQQCRGAGQRLIVPIGVLDAIGKNFLRLAHGLGIKGLDFGSGF